MNKWLLFIFCLFLQCDFTYSKKPNQALAVNLVWVETFHMVNTDPPNIDWVEGDRLNCGDGTGFVNTYSNEVSECVSGLFYADEYLIQVAYIENRAFHESSLAHEMGHTYLYRLGLQDINHESPVFRARGLVEQANKLLQDKGL